MNSSFDKHLQELSLIPSVRRITAGHEWVATSKNRKVDTDVDLIELISEMSSLFRRGLSAELKAGALLGILYVTRRIVGACEKTKLEVAHNPMEIDLALSLELPGESASGLAFLKPNDRANREGLGASVTKLLLIINGSLVKYPSNSTNNNEHIIALPLRTLSKVYCCLVGVVLEDF